MLRNLISRVLVMMAKDIKSGNCNLSTGEMVEIMNFVGLFYLNKEEACKMLNMSRQTFDRRISEGVISKGKKIVGYKSLVWSRKELSNLIDDGNCSGSVD